MANSQRRMIYVKIWTSEQFGRLSDKAKLLFIGTITLADDDGRLLANPAYLRSQIFPYDENVSVPEALRLRNEVEKVGLIAVYSTGDSEYMEHPKWKDYQIIRRDLYKPSPLPSRYDTVTKPLRKRTLSKVKLSKVKLSKDNIASPTGSATFVGTIQNYFTERYEAKFGSKPAINFGKDGKVIKSASGLFKDDVEKAKQLVDAFLDSEKAAEVGYDLSIAFSTHTINQWQAGKLKSNRTKVHHI